MMKLYSKKEEKLVSDFEFKGDKLYFDIETTGLNYQKDSPFMISWTDSFDNAYALDLREKDSAYDNILNKVATLCSDESIEKIGHNIKFDMKFMIKHYDFLFRNACDTCIIARVFKNNLTSYKLKDLAVSLLKEDISEKKALDSFFKKETIKKKEVIPTIIQKTLFGEDEGIESKKITTTETNYHEVPFDIIVQYAIADVLLTRKLYEYIMKNAEEEIHQVFAIEKSILLPIMDIELRGFLIDTEFLNAEKERFEPILKSLEEKILKETGDFEILSDEQLGEVLFTRLGFIPPATGKDGKPKVDKWTLDKIKGDNPQSIALLDNIKEYRAIAQHLSTFINGLLTRHINGVVSAEFNQAQARTGRMSCSNPNLQNLPARTEGRGNIRKAFVARKGYKLLSIDYSQIEYRLFAHYMNNDFLINSYKNGYDFHEEVTKILKLKTRRQGKDINFGMIYGMGAKTLSAKLGVSIEEAYKFVDSYFSRFPEIRKLRYQIKDVLYKRKYIKTLKGRRQYLDAEKESYKGLNAIIQGSAADIFKSALIVLFQFIEDKDIFITNLIHDEILFEISENELEHIPEIKRIMEGVVELKVPVKVDAKIGDNWLDLISLEEYNSNNKKGGG